MGAPRGHCDPADGGPGGVVSQEKDLKVQEVNVDAPTAAETTTIAADTELVTRFIGFDP